MSKWQILTKKYLAPRDSGEPINGDFCAERLPTKVDTTDQAINFKQIGR